jgi:nucleotide-binding universal stress UspA family protein
VTRVVVVSSSQIERHALADVVSADDELYVVVPAVKQSRLQWLFNDEDKARAEAQAVGESIARDAPADASEIEVKPDPPEQAVLDAIAEFHPDRIVVALREGDDATWLEGDGPDQLARTIDDIPVERIHL